MEVAETSRSKIVLTDPPAGFAPAALEALKESGVPFAFADFASEVGQALIRESEALLVSREEVTAKIISGLDRCRAIIRVGVGYDNIDSDAARARGIPVCNVPDYCKAEVADHAMAHALALARQLPFLDRCVREGNWKPILPRPMPNFEAMSFGVLGYGRIGRLTIARARGFGFRLLACDPYIPAAELPSDVRSVTLDELLAEVDILSLHVPLTGETRHILNASRLAQMKPTAILVNTARGPVVETDALVEALCSGRLGAAGIDVCEEEPLPVGHPLLALPNVLATPHWAWHSRESGPKRVLMAVEEALRCVRGEPLRNCVNGVG